MKLYWFAFSSCKVSIPYFSGFLQCWAPTVMSHQDSSSMCRYRLLKSPFSIICSTSVSVMKLCCETEVLICNKTTLGVRRKMYFLFLIGVVSVCQSPPFLSLYLWALAIVFAVRHASVFIFSLFGVYFGQLFCASITLLILHNQHVCGVCVQPCYSMCYIKHLTLDLCFPFHPVGHRVQEEVGFSGYKAWRGGQRCQHRLWSCALGYTLSSEFQLVSHFA